jgi:hypothetical protein
MNQEKPTTAQVRGDTSGDFSPGVVFGDYVVQVTPELLNQLHRKSRKDDDAHLTDLPEVCQRIVELLRTNFRVFHDFGPPERRGPVDRTLWTRQKNTVLLPNNSRVRALLSLHRKLFPESALPVIDVMLSHIDAFEINSEVRIDYVNFLYPQTFSGLMLLGSVGHYSVNYDRSGVRIWLGWKRAHYPVPVEQAKLFGSFVVDPYKARDIDVMLLCTATEDKRPLIHRFNESLSAESAVLFGIPVHPFVFSSPGESANFEHFVNKSNSRAESHEGHAVDLPLVQENL